MSKLVSALVVILLMVSATAFAADPDAISINQSIVTKAGGYSLRHHATGQLQTDQQSGRAGL